MGFRMSGHVQSVAEADFVIRRHSNKEQLTIDLTTAYRLFSWTCIRRDPLTEIRCVCQSATECQGKKYGGCKDGPHAMRSNVVLCGGPPRPIDEAQRFRPVRSSY